MTKYIKDLPISILLSGGWAVFAHMIITILPHGQPVNMMFFLLLFAGVTVIISLVSSTAVSVSRSLLVGLISGFIYELLTPGFPFIAAVLAGISLGGGLCTANQGFGAFLKKMVSVVKGLTFFPIVVLLAGFTASVIFSLSHSTILYWFTWGSWLGIGVYFISGERTTTFRNKEGITTGSSIGDFRSDARDIKRELSSLVDSIE